MAIKTQMEIIGNGHLLPMLYDLQAHFLQIKTLSESTGQTVHEEVRLISKHALDVLDYTMFSIDALQTKLPLTNASTGAAASDVAENLRLLAKSYNVDIELDITKKLEPVFTNEAAIKGALYGIVSSLITTAKTTNAKTRLIIAAQETTPTKQRLGVYSPDISLSLSAFKYAKNLTGLTRSIAPSDMQSSGIGLLISDQLTKALGCQIKRFRHRGFKGIGFYVPISTQLSLIN